VSTKKDRGQAGWRHRRFKPRQLQKQKLSPFSGHWHMFFSTTGAILLEEVAADIEVDNAERDTKNAARDPAGQNASGTLEAAPSRKRHRPPLPGPLPSCAHDFPCPCFIGADPAAAPSCRHGPGRQYAHNSRLGSCAPSQWLKQPENSFFRRQTRPWSPPTAPRWCLAPTVRHPTARPDCLGGFCNDAGGLKCTQVGVLGQVQKVGLAVGVKQHRSMLFCSRSRIVSSKSTRLALTFSSRRVLETWRSFASLP